MKKNPFRLNVMGKRKSNFSFGGIKPINPLRNFGLKPFGGKNDLDFDGVINSRDCQPRNTMRQDGRNVFLIKFLPGGLWIDNFSTDRPTIYASEKAAEFAIKNDVNLNDEPRKNYKIIKMTLGQYAIKFGYDIDEDSPISRY